MDAWGHLIQGFLIGWKNLGALYLIERTQLNGNDSHPSISSKPLIKDEELNLTVTPKFANLYACSLMENLLSGASRNQSILTSMSLNILLSLSSRSISSSKECLKVIFRGENRENLLF